MPRTASVAGCGLNPEILECAVSEDFAVGDTVQRYTACHTEIRNAVFLRQAAREVQYDFLCNSLD